MKRPAIGRSQFNHVQNRTLAGISGRSPDRRQMLDLDGCGERPRSITGKPQLARSLSQNIGRAARTGTAIARTVWQVQPPGWRGDRTGVDSLRHVSQQAGSALRQAHTSSGHTRHCGTACGTRPTARLSRSITKTRRGCMCGIFVPMAWARQYKSAQCRLLLTASAPWAPSAAR